MAQEHFAEDVREAVEAQIAELRGQLAGITRSLNEHGFDIEELADEAKGLIDGAAKNAGKVAHYAQDEAKAVAKVVRKHPAGASTALTLAVAIGFGLGYAVSQMQYENRHSRWW